MQLQPLVLYKNIDEQKLSFVPPVRPKSDEVYLYNSRGNPQKTDDWRCDSHRWYSNGTKPFPRKEGKYTKFYHALMTEKGSTNKFVRHAYRSIADNQDIIVVHYLGDHSLSVPFSHGLRRNNTRPHFRTAPSVINQLTDNQKEPSSVYRNMTTNGNIHPSLHGVMNPRDLKQVQNKKYAASDRLRLSRDSLYNLHELAYHLDGFFWDTRTYPDLVCVIGLKEMFQEFSNLLQIQSPTLVQLLSYDTTFNIGDFYVSPLIFRHLLFTGSPCMVMAFVIHERKFLNCHDALFDILLKQIPLLKRKQVTIVTDREPNIGTALRNKIPMVTHVYCWNHLKRDLRHWLLKHDGKQSDVTFYVNDMEDLLRCESEQAFDVMLDEKKTKWSQAMVEHFDRTLKNQIKQHACRWILETCNIYNPYSGVTNNSSEGFNTVLKRLTEWKEVQIDAAALSFYHLQKYYLTEIVRGRCDVGNYVLRPEFRGAAIDRADAPAIEDSCSPDEIVQLVKGELLAEIERVTADEESAEQKEPLCQRSMAIEAVRNGKVVHVPSLKTFVVEGSRGDKYAVSLFPKEKCVCPSTGTCFHIMAAKISIGMESTGLVNRKLNLTQLRRNSKKKADKKSGRKLPRINDVEQDVTAAPDSTLVNSTFVIQSQTSILETNDTLQPVPEASVSPKFGSKQIERKRRKRVTLTLPSFHSTPKRKTTEAAEQIDEVMPESAEERFHQSPASSPLWCPPTDFFLQTDDFSDLIYGQSLKSDVMNNAQKLINDKYVGMNGLEATVLAPYFEEKANTWHYYEGKKFQHAHPPSAQIHHTGKGHWVLSYQAVDSHSVYLIDSMRSSREALSPSLQIQLAAVYGHGGSQLNINMPFIQQQRNSVDCGVMCIAFLVEFCEKGHQGVLSANFDLSQIRSHLLRCFGKGDITSFPQIAHKLRSNVRCKDVQLSLHCICNMPEVFSDMIKCDRCELWFHKKCFSLDHTMDSSWFCVGCNN
ncbi:unnamed protein product [Mytilus edulis]|uniref:SWIM-type domain-containing protein n=1 Tax=Mytilus edulis TaxID=6550 RepID=A0A8S3R2M4_MYTED|nr:unnamed protein product [Mytilus edulis]